jgi:flagellar FliL protein
MATSAKAAAAKPEDPTVPKSSNKKMIIVIAVAVILIAAAGAGGWWFANKGKDHGAAAPHEEEVKVEHPKVAIFVPLEPYTVNLKRETSDQYLQMGISLKVFEPAIEAKIKESQPEIRSKILQLLTTKTASELLTQDGKNKLVKEIILLGNAVIGIVPPPPVYVPVPQPMPAAVDPHAPLPDPHAPAPHAADPHAPAADPHAPVAVAAPAPVYQAMQPAHVEPKGIIDVLFTSFIIQ